MKPPEISTGQHPHLLTIPVVGYSSIITAHFSSAHSIDFEAAHDRHIDSNGCGLPRSA